MAGDGRSYEDILSFYYLNTNLIRLMLDEGPLTPQLELPIIAANSEASDGLPEPESGSKVASAEPQIPTDTASEAGIFTPPSATELYLRNIWSVPNRKSSKDSESGKKRKRGIGW
jgi:hypothetical protein